MSLLSEINSRNWKDDEDRVEALKKAGYVSTVTPVGQESSDAGVDYRTTWALPSSTTTTTANNNTANNNNTVSNVNTSTATRATSGPQASPSGSQFAHTGSGQTHTAGTLRGPAYVNPASQTVDDYGSYVDQYTGLTNAWNLINAYNTGGDLSGFSSQGGMSPAEQAQYWNTRMGGQNTKEAFGQAHYGESVALHEGTYKGATQMPWGTGVRRYVGPPQEEAPPGDGAGTPPGGWAGSPTGDPNDTNNYVNSEPSTPFLDSVNDLSTMQFQVSEMLNKNNPLFKRAATRAFQIMNQTGTANSTMAEEAVMNAIMDVVMPIAQNDANTYFQMQQTNQNATNEFKRDANKAFYDEVITRLNNATQWAVSKLNSNTQLLSNIISARTNIATTPMGTDAANWAFGAVTPEWYNNWRPWG
tara:strand:+ start:2550 stop:3794 length:1245 start_codon:yes stop_codon:yes gene_type:complete